MIFIFALILFAISFYSAWREKSIINPLTVYCLLWGGILAFAGMRLFGMRAFSDKAPTVIFLGCTGFTTGYFIRLKFSFRHRPVLGRDENVYYVINYKLLYMLLIINMLFYLYMSVHVLNLLMNGYFYDVIRNMHQGYIGESLFASRSAWLYHSLVGGALTSLFILFSLILLFERKYSRPLFILSVLNILLYSFFTAGRFIFFQVLVNAAILLLTNSKMISKKSKGKIIKVFCLMAVGIIIITVFRNKSQNSAGLSVLQTFYMYGSSCVPLLDYHMEIADASHYQTYGGMFFYGVLDLADSLLGYLGMGDFHYTSKIKEIIKGTEQFIRIYDNQPFNAFVSVFYYFYVDFREAGVFCGNLIYGILCNYVYRAMKYNKNILNMALFLLIMQGIAKSMVRWEFAYLSTFMSYIYLFVLLSKKPK